MSIVEIVMSVVAWWMQLLGVALSNLPKHEYW